MAYLVTNTVGTKKDTNRKNRISAKQGSNVVISNRRFLPGTTVSVSDEVYAHNKPAFDRLVAKGVLQVKPAPSRAAEVLPAAEQAARQALLGKLDEASAALTKCITDNIDDSPDVVTVTHTIVMTTPVNFIDVQQVVSAEPATETPAEVEAPELAATADELVALVDSLAEVPDAPGTEAPAEAPVAAEPKVQRRTFGKKLTE